MNKFTQLLTTLILSLSFLAPLDIQAGSTGSSSRSSSSSSSSRSSGGFSSSKPSASRSSSSGGFSSSKPSLPKASSSGGFSSSKPSTSSVKPSTSAGSSWGGWSSTKTTPASASSSTSSVSSNKALNSYNRNSSITPPKSRADYTAEFKTQNAAKYTNNFKAEPATRPAYIPHTVGAYPISYNMNYGGYGYMDTLGHWVMFDALTHMADRSYGGYVQSYPTTVTHVSGGGLFSTILQIFAVCVIIAIIAVLAYHRAMRRTSY